jgi:hypothetical protein
MKPIDKSPGKIAHGLSGAGTVTQDMVEQRARELGVINGRDHYNDDDLREAKLELLGMEDTIGGGSDEELETASDFRRVENVTGQRAPVVSPTDNQALLEGLVQGGLDEAQHDTMLKGARSPENQE